MPVQRPSRPVASTSTLNKPKGFSISDIIQTDESNSMLKTSPSSSSTSLPNPYLSQAAWLPPPPPPTNIDPIVQYQLQYLRHSGRLFDGRFASPETAAALILHSFRKPKRVRTAFTPAQLLKLENAFEKNHYVVGQERKELARHLNLTETQVKVWYQNRRTKHKRLKNEDGQNSSNEMHEDEQHDQSIGAEEDEHHVEEEEEEDEHRNPSDTSTKTDDEHSWDTNNNPTNSHRPYPYRSQSSTPRSSDSDRYYVPPSNLSKDR